MIENTTTSIVYNADGINRTWDIPFTYLEANDVELYVKDATTGEYSRIVSGYSVVEDKLTYPISPVAPLAENTKVLLIRNTDKTQEESSIVHKFASSDVERMADKLTIVAQELQEQIDRSIKFNPIDAIDNTTDANVFVDNINNLKDQAQSAATQASAQAGVATEAATNAVNNAQAAADSATNAAEQAINAAQQANSSAQSAINAAQQAESSSSSAADAAAAYADIQNWISTLEDLTENEVHTYTAGTETETYSGSLTVFPVENQFAVPISVYVNGQYKEISTEYSEDKANNIITFTTALDSGDKVNIVSNIAVADLTGSGAIGTSIATHDASNSAHSTQMAAKESISNKTLSLSGSSTDTQYPSAKAVYDNLVLKQDKSNLVTTLSSSSTNTQYPSAKVVYDNITPKQNKTLDTAVTVSGVSQTTVQSALSALATASQSVASKSLDDLNSTGENHFTKPDLSNLANAGKTIIINAVMPDYANGTTVELTTGWTQVTKDSFVVAAGGDSYTEDYYAYVSPDNGTTKYKVGKRYDDTNLNTQWTSFSFFVPKNWYFKVESENGYEAYVYPLKGAQ